MDTQKTNARGCNVLAMLNSERIITCHNSAGLAGGRFMLLARRIATRVFQFKPVMFVKIRPTLYDRHSRLFSLKTVNNQIINEI